MRYLSFDIECCDGEHICEFGYVIFDDQFNILDKKNFLINPKHKFDLIGRKHSKDLILNYSEEEYRNSPEFSYYHYTIKNIIEADNQTIIGFSMVNDRNFLKTACERYAKEPISFKFNDFQTFYCAYSHANKKVSIEKVIEDLQMDGIVLHKSDDDASVVVLALKKIAEKESLCSVKETLRYLKEMTKNYNNEKAVKKIESFKHKLLDGDIKAQNIYIKNFIAKIANNAIASQDGARKVCFGVNYQKFYFNELIALIQELYKNNYKYTGKVSECDIFVKFDHFDKGELCADVRYEAAIVQTTSGDTSLDIILLEEFLQSLKLSREILSNKLLVVNYDDTLKIKSN